MRVFLVVMSLFYFLKKFEVEKNVIHEDFLLPKEELPAREKY